MIVALFSLQLHFMATNEAGPLKNTSGRGFASMNPQKQKEIASLGGKTAHEKGRAHQFNSDEARAAGKKGGEVVSRNREHMSMIGKKGGEHSRNNRNKAIVTLSVTRTG
jgi:general stress protein YciG